ncbi:uncharacterized protein LOC111279747 isoform X2 [Durio zibethinus]|uniref:Uncharacterized protein LOC111279747 isoform X2 n=1 Tax=Durio zibethinus TaxID=66656 RepID=A0A6P5X4L3_DURZI|nr:uncharacterized protein LOC111279747 isoform X2 [Durio zibethinus]
MGGEDVDRDKSKLWLSPNRAYKEKEDEPKLWGIFLFGLIAATAKCEHLRSRSQSSWKGGSLRTLREEAWRRYNRRMQEEYEEEMKRVISLLYEEEMESERM